MTFPHLAVVYFIEWPGLRPVCTLSTGQHGWHCLQELLLAHNPSPVVSRHCVSQLIPGSFPVSVGTVYQHGWHCLQDDQLIPGSFPVSVGTVYPSKHIHGCADRSCQWALSIAGKRTCSWLALPAGRLCKQELSAGTVYCRQENIQTTRQRRLV